MEGATAGAAAMGTLAAAPMVRDEDEEGVTEVEQGGYNNVNVLSTQ